MKRSTIKDIAHLVGVNPSTISRALHDHQDISIELRKKIKEVAQQLNYTPNEAALNLKNKSSKLIGLIVPQIGMHFVPSVINGISQICNQAGYKLMILSSEDELEKEIENIKICCQSAVDGIIISLTNKTTNLNHFALAEELEIPVIIFDKTIPQETFDEIIIDDYLVGQSCANYLIQQNCKNIIGVFGNPHLSITQKRMQGFSDEITKHKKIKFTHLYAHTSEETSKLLSENLSKKIDGIFAMSDETMLGVNSVLYSFQLNNIKTISISDGKLPQFMTPPMNYFKHCGYSLGKLASNKMIDKIVFKKEHTIKEKMFLKTELVEI